MYMGYSGTARDYRESAPHRTVQYFAHQINKKTTLISEQVPRFDRSSLSRFNMHVAIGDLNTRLHARLNGEGDVLGNLVFGRGSDVVQKLSRDDKEHRKELISSLQCTEHVVCNSYFQKESRFKATRAEIGI